MDVRNQISFWTTFPRKHLGEDDFHKTLVDLDLAPSAALIVDLVKNTLCISFYFILSNVSESKVIKNAFYRHQKPTVMFLTHLATIHL